MYRRFFIYKNIRHLEIDTILIYEIKIVGAVPTNATPTIGRQRYEGVSMSKKVKDVVKAKKDVAKASKEVYICPRCKHVKNRGSCACSGYSGH
jgi:hypothetical protein